MGAGAVERARLESVCAGNSTEGSNPTPSATFYKALKASHFRGFSGCFPLRRVLQLMLQHM